jgi:hypothetical protein
MFITSLIIRISYPDHVVELIDFQNLIFFIIDNTLNCNIKTIIKGNPVMNYSFKNRINNVHFNFSRLYFSKDLKMIHKIVLQYLIEGEEYMNQFKREFNEEEEINSLPLLSTY